MTKTQRIQHMDVRSIQQLEQLEILARQGPVTFAFSVINAGIVYFVLQDVANGNYLWAWTSAVIAFNALRLVMVVIFARMSDDASYRTWAALYFSLVYLSGLAWGVLALLPVFKVDPWIQSFVIFVIAGMSAGGIVSLYAKLSAAIPYYLFSLLPLILVLATTGDPVSISMAVLACFFLVLLTRTTYLLNGQIRQAIRLEIENRDLFSFLTRAREQSRSKEDSEEAVRLGFL